ncbi:MAG: hypothetical protein CL472_09205 [Acidobacteria bacterium]|nr:hypothetical protein [Acidobacteriota bacterium]
MRIGSHLPYPSLPQLLDMLGNDVILVGSAARCPDSAKDYDFVISRPGLARLLVTYGYFLCRERKGWYIFLPQEGDAPAHKPVDFFCGLHPVDDPTKLAGRITYEEAATKPLTVSTIAGIEVLALKDDQ